MMKKQSLPLVLVVILTFFAFCLPHAAYATDTPSSNIPNNCIDGTYDSNAQAAAANAAQAKQTAVNNSLSLWPVIDIKTQYCWTTIKTMFAGVGSMSDPMGLVWDLVAQQILALADQVCSAAISVASQVKSFALSQLNRLCLPLPTMGLGGINLGLQGPPCNGIQLLSVTASPRPNQSSWDPRSFFP